MSSEALARSATPRLRAERGRRPLIGRLDRYIIHRTLPLMSAVLAGTMTAFLAERLLRSFDLLSQSSRGFDFLAQLAVDLVPHYIGLTLPGGFFVALFVTVNRLNNASEVDALLASGVSLSRITAPLVGLGVALMFVSLLLYGFLQPYSRYAYHAVLHAAANAGWSGEVKPLAILSPDPKLVLTADEADSSGSRLRRVFIRRVGPDGGEEALTARTARVQRDADRRTITLDLQDGQLLRTPPGGSSQLLTFSSFTMRLPLVPVAQLLRPRGGQELDELTLVELVEQGLAGRPSELPRQALLAELYARLARAAAMVLMPLLAVPFGLTAKRAGSTPGMAVAGVLLFTFQASLIFGQGLAARDTAPASVAVGVPFALFAAICIAAFLTSRKRPGQNPINWLAERMGDAITAIRRGGRQDGGDDAGEEGLSPTP